MVNAFKETNNVDVPYKIVDRREGDIATCYAKADKVYEEKMGKYGNMGGLGGML